MTKEHTVKRKVKEVLKGLGKDVVYCMPMGTGYGNSGVGDFVFCYQGKYHEIETKTVGNEPTALQEKRQRDVIAAGGKAVVINESNLFGLREWIVNG